MGKQSSSKQFMNFVLEASFGVSNREKMYMEVRQYATVVVV